MAYQLEEQDERTFKTTLADEDLLEIRRSMGQTLLGDIENKLKQYLSESDTSDFGIQLAQTIESIMLFGIIDPSKAWSICEFMIKKHCPLFDNPFFLINNAGLPKTNVGRFRCFLRLLLIDSQFLQYWKCLPQYPKFINSQYHGWSIVRENKAYKKLESLLLEYNDSIFIQIPIDFENLDNYSYKLDRHGFVQPSRHKEHPTEISSDVVRKTSIIHARTRGMSVKGNKMHKNKDKERTKTKHKEKDKSKTKHKSKKKRKTVKIMETLKTSKHHHSQLSMTLMDSATPLTDLDTLETGNNTANEENSNEQKNEIVTNYKDVNMTNDPDLEELSFESTDSSVITKQATNSSHYNGVGHESSPIPPDMDENEHNNNNAMRKESTASNKSNKSNHKLRKKSSIKEREEEDDIEIEKLIDKSLLEHRRTESNATNDTNISSNSQTKTKSKRKKSHKSRKKSSKSHKKSKKSKQKRKSTKKKTKKNKTNEENREEPSIHSDVQESERRENSSNIEIGNEKMEVLSPRSDLPKIDQSGTNSNNSSTLRHDAPTTELKTNDTSVIGNESEVQISRSNSNTNNTLNNSKTGMIDGKISVGNTALATALSDDIFNNNNDPHIRESNVAVVGDLDQELEDTLANWRKHNDTMRQLSAAEKREDLQITDEDDLNTSDPIPDLPDDLNSSNVNYAKQLTDISDNNNENDTENTPENNLGAIGDFTTVPSKVNRNGINDKAGTTDASRRPSSAAIDIERMLGPSERNRSFSNSYSQTREFDIDNMNDFSRNSISMMSMSMDGGDGMRMTEIMDAGYFNAANSDYLMDNDAKNGDNGSSDEIYEEWKSERKLIENCWLDPLVHDGMQDVRIVRTKKQVLSKTSKAKFDLCKESQLHSYYGVLWKKGESHNKWKQRYFELDWSKNDFRMKYYNDRSKKQKKGYINLKNAYMVSTRLEQKGHKKWTQITIWEPSREWQLATDDESYSGYWVGVIDNAMNKVTRIVRNQLYAKKYIYYTDKCVILQGWLKKSNPKGKGFKDRWWYLNTNLEKSPKLRYYEKDMSGKIDPNSNKIIKGYKGEIDITKALHVGPCLEKHLFDEHSLCLDIVMKERTYHLVANRLEQMELWLQTLHYFVPVDSKKTFGNIYSGSLQRKIATKQLAGPANSNWQPSHCVLTARSLYYFKSEESYQLYRRAQLSGDSSKMKLSNIEGIFEFKPGMTFYELKGRYENEHSHCFALVLDLDKNKKKRKVTIFEAKNREDFLQWEQNFKAMGIEHKAVPAVGNNLFM